MSDLTHWRTLYPDIATAREDIRRIEEWIEALRSGLYKQTTGSLYNSKVDGYCCLGVAHRVINKCTKEDLEGCAFTPNGNKPKTFLLMKCGGIDLTEVIENKVSLPACCTTFLVSAESLLALFPKKAFDDNSYYLNNLNDSLGFTFDEIALVLEQLILLPLKKDIENLEENK